MAKGLDVRGSLNAFMSPKCPEQKCLGAANEAMKYRTWVNEPLGPRAARRQLLGRDGGRQLDDSQLAGVKLHSKQIGHHNIQI